MAAVQEIPPPEVSPAQPGRWALPAALLSLVTAVVIFSTLTDPETPAFEWAQQPSPPGSVNLDTLVAIDDGFALLSGMTADGVLLWSLGSGVPWQSQPLPGAPSQLAPLGDSLIAYGINEGFIVHRDDSDWVESQPVSFPSEIRSRQDSGRPSVIGDDERLLAITLLGDIWWTSDGVEFAKVVGDPDWGPGVEQPFDPACRPPSRSAPDIPPLVETDSGFVAMVSTNPSEPFGIWPVCEPRVWVSENGKDWTATESKIGDGGYVYDLAWREGRFVAVGGFGLGEPMAWTSQEGFEWDAIPPLSSEPDVDLITVEAGAAGWVVLGRDEGAHTKVGWTSVDGICWEPLPAYAAGSDVAVSQDQILILKRGSVPSLWTGTPTGDRGICG